MSEPDVELPRRLDPDPDLEKRQLGLDGPAQQVLPWGPEPEPAPRNRERRRSPRVTPDQTTWCDVARLRPGVDARIVDIGTRGALFEVPARMYVGARVLVSLVAVDTGRRLDLGAIVRRCFVASLDPISYRGAVEFDREIDISSAVNR